MTDEPKPIRITVKATRQRQARPVEVRIQGQRQRYICRSCKGASAYYIPYCLSCFGKMDEFPRDPTHLVVPEVERGQREPLAQYFATLRRDTNERQLKKALKREPIYVAADLTPGESEILGAQIRRFGVVCQVLPGGIAVDDEDLLLPSNRYIYPTTLGVEFAKSLEAAVEESGPTTRRLFAPLLHFALMLSEKLVMSEMIRTLFPEEQQGPAREVILAVANRGMLLFSSGSRLERLDSSGVAAQAWQGPRPGARIKISGRARPQANGPKQYRAEYRAIQRELEALADGLEQVFSRLLVRVLGQAPLRVYTPLELPVQSEGYSLLRRMGTEFDILDRTLEEMIDLNRL
ncbi:MAG: hypothetical protein KC609_04610 [Myxococcales bacterium]|nr:hypothetical protein [Myxococcales bacterium]